MQYDVGKIIMKSLIKERLCGMGSYSLAVRRRIVIVHIETLVKLSNHYSKSIKSNEL